MKKKANEKSATFLARGLFRQIQATDSQCAFWVISALEKLRCNQATLPCVINIARQEMPGSAADYDEYLRTT